MSFPPGAGAMYLDIDGNPIPTDEVYMDSAGQMFDITKLHQAFGQWFYRGRPFVHDAAGVVIIQHSAHAYRDPPEQTSDDSPPRSAQQSADRATDSHLHLQSDNQPGPHHRTLPTKPNLGNIPKMKDLNLDRIPQTGTVTPRPRYVPRNQETIDSFLHETALTVDLLQVPGQPAKRKFFGYNPREIILQGAIHCNPCRPSNLTYSPTLKIFRDENFNDVPQDVFNIIKPALALAELIILKGHPSFWIDTACGLRTVDAQATMATARRVETLHPVASITPENQKECLEKLERMGELTRYHFADQPHDTFGRCTVKPVIPNLFLPEQLPPGTIWPSHIPFRLPPHHPDPWQRMTQITINQNFLITAQSIAKQKYPDTAAVLRFQFFFAVNLCHELAHAFEEKCGMGNYHAGLREETARYAALGQMRPWFPPRLGEARYKNYSPPEAGGHFEKETFGYRVHPVNNDFALRYGVGATLANVDGGLGSEAIDAIVNRQPYSRTISMGYIEELLQQSFWARTRTAEGLKIPEYGAISHNMNGTSLVNWRQHLNANDPMSAYNFDDFFDQDLFDTSTAEEPDSKRRRPNPPSPPSRSTDRKTLHRGGRRLLQTRIRRFPSKADADEAAMRAQLIAEAEKEEFDAAARAAQARADVDAARQYRPPPPDQPAIDDKFNYVAPSRNPGDGNQSKSSSGSSSADSRHNPYSENYDPLTKTADKLTVQDKWFLLEEFCCLAFGWDPATFLAKRTTGALWPVHHEIMPTDLPDSWAEHQLESLRGLRRKFPELSLPGRRQKKREEQARNKKLWTMATEMEELAAYKGYSRIAFQRSWAAGTPLPEGMTLDNFEQDFRSDLLAYRQIHRAKGTEAFKAALAKGEIVFDSQDVVGASSSLIQPVVPDGDDDDANDDADAVATKEAPIQGAQQRNKITSYFSAPKTPEPKKSSSSESSEWITP